MCHNYMIDFTSFWIILGPEKQFSFNFFYSSSYVYQKASKIDGEVEFFTCSKAGKKSLGCKARITMAGDKVLRTTNEHTCKDVGEVEEHAILKVSTKWIIFLQI